MADDYAELRKVLESSGYFTTDRGDNVVCASKQYVDSPRAGGLGGRSFWVAKRGGKWYVATWAPVVYRLSEPSRIGELCLELLRSEGGAYWDFDPGIRERFGLAKLTDEELRQANLD